MATASDSSSAPAGDGAASARARILAAAFAAFVAKGYAQTSMLEIATRAKVSKRELYALVGAKKDMLTACITERAGRMRPPVDVAAPGDRDGLAATLAAFGERLLREVCDPTVLAVFRLAIAEADRAPEIAETLESIARAAARRDLAAVLAQARTSGLVDGDPAAMTQQFLALLWGDLMIGLLMRVADPPSQGEIQRRAQEAASALLRLHSKPEPRSMP